MKCRDLQNVKTRTDIVKYGKRCNDVLVYATALFVFWVDFTRYIAEYLPVCVTHSHIF